METDALRQRRNTIARDINAAKKAGQDAQPLMAEAAALPEKIRACDAEQERDTGDDPSLPHAPPQYPARECPGWQRMTRKMLR